jgi:hypothetical protein
MLAQGMRGGVVSALMPRVFPSTLRDTDLRMCPACRQPFVAPHEVLASHEDGDMVVDLRCANCGWSSIQLRGRVELRALDSALDRDTAQIEAAAEALALTVELERIERFAHALDGGHILPEDF